MAASPMHSAALLKFCFVRDGGLHGRGVYAASNIPAGTIIFTESPFVEIEVGDGAEFAETMHVAIARTIVSGAVGEKEWLAPKLGKLHPLSMEAMVKECSYPSEIQEFMLEAALGKWDADEIALLIQRVRFNSFGSGLYEESSLFNHACRPNCSKFSKQDPHTHLSTTEFVATRDIAKDEELTINYFGLLEYSFAYRDKLFYSQHFAHLDPSPFPADMEQVLSAAEESNAQVLALEEDLDREFHSVGLQGGEAHAAAAGDMLVRLQQLRSLAATLVGPAHLVLIRIDRLVVLLCVLTMSSVADAKQRATTAMLLVTTGLALYPVMEQHLGPQHCELATFLLDLHHAIEFLLSSHMAAAMHAAFPEQMGTFSKATRFSYKLKTQSARIQAQYGTKS